MVGTYGGSGSHVALTLDAGGNEEGVVVVLLVSREDQVVEDFAAGNGAVVAHYRVDDPRPVFEVTVGSDDEFDRNATVEDTASVTHDSVDKNDVFANL